MGRCALRRCKKEFPAGEFPASAVIGGRLYPFCCTDHMREALGRPVVSDPVLTPKAVEQGWKLER